MADPTQHGTLLKDDNGEPTIIGNYAHITATGTALIKAGAGFLYAIVLNTPVATTVIEYDDVASATRSGPMGIITIPATPQPQTIVINAAFSNGLAFTLATAASDITVIYR